MKTIGKNRAPVLASSVNLGGKYAGASVYNDAGEINAATKQDALSIIAASMNIKGGIQVLHTENELEALEAASKERQERMDAVAAAVADKTGIVAAELGAEIAATIYQNATKLGFMRNFLVRQEVTQGQLPRVTIDRRDVGYAELTGPTQAQLQICRDYWIILPEWDLTVRIEIEGKRLAQSAEDILQEKFNQGLEAVLIGEDRAWKVGADLVIDSDGSMASIAVGSVTPSILKTGFTNLTGNGMSVSNIIFAAPLLGDVALDTGFGVIIDPITRLEILKTGNFGVLYGAKVWTDAVRDPRQKVLASNEIYLMADPRYVGAYSDRGGTTSKPLSAAETSINGLGWHINELLGMGVYGERGIARIRLT